MKTKNSLSFKHYGISHPSDNRWVVGKGNSLSRIYWFQNSEQAIAKLGELEPDFVIRAVNSHEMLLESAKCALKEMNKVGFTCQNLERAIARAEGDK